MLAYLDQLIEAGISSPARRPQMLFLTGDQIYADDVADVLLFMLQDAVNALKIHDETLSDDVAGKDMRPGMRSEVVKDVAKMTVDTAVNYSHLLTLGEFCAMYLFAWSPVLWPSTDNMKSWRFADFFGDGYALPHWMRVLNQVFDQAVPHLVAFRESLENVRRALANIPTYMMFDDHEVTDDLFLNREWCVDVLGGDNSLGRRIIQNGLAACALFQSWGNTPQQFRGENPGKDLLDLVTDGLEKPGNRDKLDVVLGLPPAQEIESWDGNTLAAMGPRDKALPFHFTVEGPDYRALFLNIRTHRAFPTGDDDEPAEQISDAGLKAQIPAPLAEPKALTFIISPAPVFDIEWIENAKWWADLFRSKTYLDYERWNLSEACFGRLLDRIADLGAASRAVILSGDVHYGYAAAVNYSGAADVAIAHFVASSLKNQTSDFKGTLKVQMHGYDFDVIGFDREPVSLEPKQVPKGGHGCYVVRYVDGAQEPAPTSPGKVDLSTLKQPIVPDGTQVVGFNNLGVITTQLNANAVLQATQQLHWAAPNGAPVTTTYTLDLAVTPVSC